MSGDATYPFTPHLAQGGAQALEDAVSLGLMLEAKLPSASVSERLRLYNDARYARSSKMQELSRAVRGDRLASDAEGDNTLSGKCLLPMNIGVKIDARSQSAITSSMDSATTRSTRPPNGFDSSSGNNNPLRWRQPIVFGPAPGLRQND